MELNEQIKPCGGCPGRCPTQGKESDCDGNCHEPKKDDSWDKLDELIIPKEEEEK